MPSQHFQPYPVYFRARNEWKNWGLSKNDPRPGMSSLVGMPWYDMAGENTA